MRKKFALVFLLTLCGGFALFAEESVASLTATMDMLWLILTGSLVFFMQSRLRPGRNRIDPGQERDQHHHEEPDGLLSGIFGVLDVWLGTYVRSRPIRRPGGILRFLQGPHGGADFLPGLVLQGRVRRNRCHHRIGSHGRKNPILILPHLYGIHLRA